MSNIDHSETIKKILITCIPIIIISALIIAAYEFIINTPLAKGLSELLGGVGGMLAAIGQQLDTCNKDGYFNVKGGCYLGIIGIGVGLLYAGYKFASFFSKPTNPIFENLAQLQGTDTLTASEVIRTSPEFQDFYEKLNSSKLSPSEQATATQKAYLEIAKNKIVEIIKKSNLSPEAKKSLFETLETQYNDEKSEIDKDTLEQDVKDINEFVKESGISTEPIPVIP
jgi:hypothetical protein